MRLISCPSSILPQGQTCPSFFAWLMSPEWMGVCGPSSVFPSSLSLSCSISILRSLMMFLYSLMWMETSCLLVIWRVFMFFALG